MAKLRGKGTNLQLTISASLTTIAQVESFSIAESDPETVETDTLDNTDESILMTNTGRASVPTITGTLIFDPGAATHEFLIDTEALPPTTAIAGKIVMTNSNEITFNCIGVGLGMTIAAGDVVKAPFTLKLESKPVYPT